ncbi:MAG: hypothetical protein JNJ57_21580 [Saprospiraceae bacterium]|nr:hypothetical protein [Saprospiraceae bacterium]
MKNVLLFLLAALSLGACKSLKVSDFHTKQSIPEKLPDLGLLVHERSFLAAFDEEYLRRKLSDDNDIWFGFQITDQALSDVFKLLENDLQENITQNGDGKYGHARFKLVEYRRPWRGVGWIVPSIATLFVANVAGMPFAVVRAELELQMEITDAEGNVLIRYVAPGFGKSPQAFYYGYTASDAVRRANLNALKDAINQIKGKMAADVPMLTGKLLASGKVKKENK